MIKVLWLAPSFNHYKAKLLNEFAKDQDVDLTILAGSGREGFGDVKLDGQWVFKYKKIDVLKSNFGISIAVRDYIKNNHNGYDWILIPAEKKNFLLLLYTLYCRIKSGAAVKLFSYNHPLIKSKTSIFNISNKFITKLFYRLLDKVIFYTEISYNNALEKALVNKNKAYWANNTLNTREIETHYSFGLPPMDKVTILFLGRLIVSKRIDFFLDYTAHLESRINRPIEIEIIGDGPCRHYIEEALKTRDNVTWYGAVADEKIISPIMSKTSLVFIPGLSGLSINHALAYGRPYATLEALRHGPEISYLKHNLNGFILSEDFKEIDDVLIPFLNSNATIKKFCIQSKKDGEAISLQKWINAIKFALLN